MVVLNLGPENRHNMHAHFEQAARVAAEISKEFKYPNELEFEKVRYIVTMAKTRKSERLSFVVCSVTGRICS